MSISLLSGFYFSLATSETLVKYLHFEGMRLFVVLGANAVLMLDRAEINKNWNSISRRSIIILQFLTKKRTIESGLYILSCSAV